MSIPIDQMSPERAYTATELAEIIEQLRASMGSDAWVHLSFTASPYGNSPVVRIAVDRSTTERGVAVEAPTIEEALTKARESVAYAPKPSDAFAILGIPYRAGGGLTMSDPLVKCPECDGAGWNIDIQAACCGRTYKSGECKGDCAVPEQIQVGCDFCGGCGEVHESVLREEAFNQGPLGVGA